MDSTPSFLNSMLRARSSPRRPSSVGRLNKEARNAEWRIRRRGSRGGARERGWCGTGAWGCDSDSDLDSDLELRLDSLIRRPRPTNCIWLWDSYIADFRPANTAKQPFPFNPFWRRTPHQDNFHSPIRVKDILSKLLLGLGEK